MSSWLSWIIYMIFMDHVFFKSRMGNIWITSWAFRTVLWVSISESVSP
jgi:hypothetical protein